MITKKFWTRVLVCTLVFQLIGLGRGQSVPVTMCEPLSIAMQATGAEVSRVCIMGSGKVTLKDQSIDGLKKIAEESASLLGIEKGNYEMEERINDTRLGVSIFSAVEKTRVMIWIRLPEESTEKNCAALTVKIVEITPDEKDIVRHQNMVDRILQKFATAHRISTCLEGYLDGRLRKDEWVICLRDAFNAIGAEIHTMTDGGTFMSYTGYSPLIWEEGIVVGGDRTNINMAVRYHSFDQRTYFVIGSPVIAVEY